MHMRDFQFDFDDARHRYAWWAAVKDKVKQRLRAKERRLEGNVFASLTDVYRHVSTEDAGRQWGRQSAPPLEFVEIIRRLYPDADNIAMNSKEADMRLLILEAELRQCQLDLERADKEVEERFKDEIEHYRDRIVDLEAQNKQLVEKLIG